MVIQKIRQKQYEYGCYSFFRGHEYRNVIGEVNQVDYEAKRVEIDSANFVSSGGLGHDPDPNTQWFIEEIVKG